MTKIAKMGALKWPKRVFWVFLLSLTSLLSITSLDSMRDELPLNKWSHLTARVYVNIIRPKNWGQLLSQKIRRHISQGKSLFSFNFWEESFNLGGLNKKFQHYWVVSLGLVTQLLVEVDGFTVASIWVHQITIMLAQSVHHFTLRF